jgi:hypothetical protein
MSWELLVSLLTVTISAGAVAFSVWRYSRTRRVELAWKRTEFLCTQAEYLDTDDVLNEAVRILEDRHPEITIPQIYGEDGNLDQAKRNEYLHRMDRLLNFLWRLSYAYLETKTISQGEIEGFSWYFRRISQFPVLTEYCESNGFEEINTVTATLERLQGRLKLNKERQQKLSAPLSENNGR